MENHVTDSVYYVGANDHDVDLFEGQYVVPDGMAYNSYVIMDDSIAVMDTIDQTKTQEWLDNIEKVLDGAMPDYLVVQHMEPDHAGSIEAFVNKYPCDDGSVLPGDEDGAHEGNQRRRYSFPGKPYFELCGCTYGSLAGSYDDL